MITALTQMTPTLTDFLANSWRGRQILATYDAYGTQYDFCHFFTLDTPDSQGVLLFYNATLLICGTGTPPQEELSSFITMYAPFRIECPLNYATIMATLPQYHSLHRTTFSLTPFTPSPQFNPHQINPSPNLDDVYAILQEGFPNLLEYPLWLTDTSHRIRHGISQCFTYQNTSTITRLYDRDNYVLIGQVATRVASRGQGIASDFLCYIATMLSRHHKTAALYALDIRDSFYRSLGFTPINEEIVYQRIADEHNTDLGALS